MRNDSESMFLSKVNNSFGAQYLLTRRFSTHRHDLTVVSTPEIPGYYAEYNWKSLQTSPSFHSSDACPLSYTDYRHSLSLEMSELFKQFSDNPSFRK